MTANYEGAISNRINDSSATKNIAKLVSHKMCIWLTKDAKEFNHASVHTGRIYTPRLLMTQVNKLKKISTPLFWMMVVHPS